MSPTETLAAARLNQVGPYLPVTWDLLAKIGEWIGPAECYANGFMVQDHVDRWDLAPLHMCVDYVQANQGDDEVPSHVRLDTRRPEVRHLLCDLGVAPEWARRSAAACWVAGSGVGVAGLLPAWTKATWSSGEVTWSRGNRTGDIATDDRQSNDLTSLRYKNILTEPDGYYVPLADGGIGWWAHG